MPCKGVSLMHPELVPALCTHRPSLLLIEFCDKDLVLWTFVFTAVESSVSKVFVPSEQVLYRNLFESCNLEEGEVVQGLRR